MFSALYFTYGGVFSGTYGLKIMDFEDNNGTVNTESFSPVLKTIKPAGSNRFYHAGIDYDSPPEFSFSVVSESPIDEYTRREILSWLIGRKSFLPLILHQSDLNHYTINCVFTSAELIYMNGYCIGFSLTATADSPYAKATPDVFIYEGDGTEDTFNILCNTDLQEEYIYPIITFNDSTGSSSNKNISIFNMSDSGTREFAFTGLGTSADITVDNETRYIHSEAGATGFLSKFNKNWLRLKRGRNELKITLNGTATISCPNYVMIGF